MLKGRKKILQFNAKPFRSLEVKISPIVLLVSRRLGISWLPSFAWPRFPSADWQLTKRCLSVSCFLCQTGNHKNTNYFHQKQGSTAILGGSWTLNRKIGTHRTWLDMKMSDYSHISRTSSWQAFCHLCMHIIYPIQTHFEKFVFLIVGLLGNQAILTQNGSTQMSAAGSIHQVFFSLPSRCSSTYFYFFLVLLFIILSKDLIELPVCSLIFNARAPV